MERHEMTDFQQGDVQAAAESSCSSTANALDQEYPIEVASEESYHNKRLGEMARRHSCDSARLRRLSHVKSYIALLESQLETQGKMTREYLNWINREFPSQNKGQSSESLP